MCHLFVIEWLESLYITVDSVDTSAGSPLYTASTQCPLIFLKKFLWTALHVDLEKFIVPSTKPVHFTCNMHAY